MLVIRRRVGESLVIAGDVEIEILGLAQNQVKLGIRAPKTVPIVRKEILVTGEQNLAAARLESLDSVANLLGFLRKIENSSNNPPAAR
jgi:carbon storage regulator